ncbi:MAG TPA: Crp/Fnr family transcriptional regulator [Allosphingosinicella sp.]|jgi:CRP-like cAMP-binding protein|nr:Crp/Fnr family transcriptional regulator [Allosphingosinicella sp.]
MESGERTHREEEPFPLGLREAYLARAQLIKVRRGQIIISEGSDTTEVYLIRSGKVQISLFSLHGREVILREMGADQIFGELAAIDGQRRSANVIAVEDSVLALMRGEQFVDFLGAVPQAGLWMSRLLVARIRNLTSRAFELATLPVAGRIHSELLRLARESGVDSDRLTIQPMPTHADLAARIGTHREAVTRELNLLAGEGILHQSGRRVEILSVAKLHALYDRIRR